MPNEPCPPGFSAADACTYTGCTHSQLRYWDTVGLVRPSVRPTNGKAGVRRCYAFADLVALRSIKSLLDAGVTLQRVRRAFAQLRISGLDGRLERLRTDGRTVYAVDEQGVIIDALRTGQLAFFVAIEEIAGGIETAGFRRDREVLRRAIRTAERDINAPRRRRRASGA